MTDRAGLRLHAPHPDHPTSPLCGWPAGGGDARIAAPHELVECRHCLRAQRLESERLHREGLRETLDRGRAADINDSRLRTLALAYLDADDHDQEKRLVVDIIAKLETIANRPPDPRHYGPSGSAMDTFR